MTDFDFDTPLTDKEWDTLEDFIIAQQEISPFTTVSAIDGFLTAVVSGPEMVPPSEWLPVIFGGDMESPKWESEEQPEVIIGLLLRLMNNIATVLSETPDIFSPLFLAYRDELADNPEDEEFLVPNEWCWGYLQGFMLRRDDWTGHEEAFEEFIHPIFIYGSEEGEAILDNMSDEEDRALTESLPQLAIDIYNYWLEIRSNELNPDDFAELNTPQEPFFRVEPKVGRNDPCPCGSGKKYKKCCGLN